MNGQSKLSLNEFPSLSSTSTKPAAQSQASQKSQRSQMQNDSFPSSEARSIENLLQTDLTQQDFCHALSSEMNLIPDPPYESHEVESKNAIETRPSYPQTKNMKLTQPEFFKKYDNSTLFFIFFFSPGTSQQYFAGRELLNRDWFFHLKFGTWFHRIEEPSQKTSEFEVSKYEYFDHSSNENWCVRERQNFRLDYASIMKL